VAENTTGTQLLQIKKGMFPICITTIVSDIWFAIIQPSNDLTDNPESTLTIGHVVGAAVSGFALGTVVCLVISWILKTQQNRRKNPRYSIYEYAVHVCCIHVPIDTNLFCCCCSGVLGCSLQIIQVMKKE
jgi:hypothetical protein